MSQSIPRSAGEILPLPDFHDDSDIFAGDHVSTVIATRPWRQALLLSVGLLALFLPGIVLLLILNHRTYSVYQMQKVRQGDLAQTLAATGLLHSSVYSLNFPRSGKLAEVDVKVGQQVKQDQIVAKLDATSLQNALNEAQATLSLAQITLDNANASLAATASAGQMNLAAAQSSLSNVEVSGFVSSNAQVVTAQQRLEDVQGQNMVQEAAAQGKVNAAQGALHMAQAQLATAKQNCTFAILTAPHAGTVAAVNGVVGGIPGPEFVQIVDLSLLQVQANIAETAVSAVAVGNPVKFSVDTYPDQMFDGVVTAISPLSQSVARVVTYPIDIDMTTAIPTKLHLLPGMTVRTTITTTLHADVLQVPVTAVVFAQAALKPSAEIGYRSLITQRQAESALVRARAMLQNLSQDVLDEKPVPAFVLQRVVHGASTTTVVRPVVIGLSNGTSYEVLGGLSLDDNVCVSAHV